MSFAVHDSIFAAAPPPEQLAPEDFHLYVDCIRDTAVHGEKRTSGFDAICSNRLRENPRLSDDGIRGKSLLAYDVVSDAGVGAKSDV